MTRTLEAMVRNGPESLMRITGLMKRRGCEVKKLSLELDEASSMSKLVITLGANEMEMDNIIMQMRRFQDVMDLAEYNR
ncbi:MAG: ACT domain-containing protein [Gudongella sp.]|nr:ACT domain-containing protein [Gudongella sp.]